MDSNIKTIVAKFFTDKPVRKTPYQVKGVFIRNFKNESIVPMLDGSKRDKFLYPRVQVKILDEQIYLIGINEGVSPVLEISGIIKRSVPTIIRLEKDIINSVGGDTGFLFKSESLLTIFPKALKKK